VSKAAVLNFPEPKKARLYYLDKKTNRHKRLSDNIFRDLQYVTRPNDRRRKISLKARNLLTNLLQMILKNPYKEEFVDHTFLSQITEVYSSKQNARLLDQISDIIDSTYHAYVKFQGKSRTYGYVIKLTEDGYERAKNPVAFYSDLDGQKCPVDPTKMSTQVDKNVQIYKDKENPEEEINHSYANGFISEKEKSYKKEKPHKDQHATFAPCFPSGPEQVAHNNQAEKATHTQHKERTSENTGLFAMSDLMAKVLNDPQKEEEIPEMNLEDLPRLTEKEERSVLLSRTLQQAFGEQRSSEIQNDYKFVEQDQQKVCIQTKAMLLNDIEKAKIRKTIQSVYGEDVTISMQLLEPIEVEPHKQETPVTAKDMPRGNWLKFKESISDSKLLTILTNRLVKATEKEETLIIEAAPLFIEDLTAGGHLTALEDAIVQTGITLELHYSGLNTSYTNAAKQKITLTPEQIIKDREWIRVHRKAINELDKK
jgi:hypothetical protein